MKALSVDRLSKQYLIGAAKPKYRTLRDSIASLWGRRENGAAPRTSFWALKDVTFEVEQGKVLGVIGRNGAGKSTLLKVLSRITEPTAGRAEIRGRVGSLLEVGTGFHPELTGRENVFLNGAILGMRREETARKFDEIVAFSEVEKFIDTAVKHYSSGMYLRLAFAVAAHLEPEILLVDEVLAVGDAGFQKKCISKMGDVAQQGRTVLMVSHNLGIVQEICDEAILLDSGHLREQGPAAQVVSSYLREIEQKAARSLEDRTDRRGRGRTRLKGLGVGLPSAPGTDTLISGCPARFEFLVAGPGTDLVCNFTVYNQHGQPVVNFRSDVHAPQDGVDGGSFTCDVEEMLLLPGHYRINVALVRNEELEDHVEAAAIFVVEPGVVRGRRVVEAGKYGLVTMPHRWAVPTA